MVHFSLACNQHGTHRRSSLRWHQQKATCKSGYFYYGLDLGWSLCVRTWTWIWGLCCVWQWPFSQSLIVTPGSRCRCGIKISACFGRTVHSFIIKKLFLGENNSQSLKDFLLFRRLCGKSGEGVKYNYLHSANAYSQEPSRFFYQVEYASFRNANFLQLFWNFPWNIC